MSEVDPDELRKAVEGTHGGTATLAQAVPVRETFQGEAAWEGVVHVFHLHGHPSADLAYAWSTVLDEGTGRRRFYAVLHAGPIKSPTDAVRAALVAEHRAKS